jgi:hypothetical protein
MKNKVEKIITLTRTKFLGKAWIAAMNVGQGDVVRARRNTGRLYV